MIILINLVSLHACGRVYTLANPMQHHSNADGFDISALAEGVECPQLDLDIQVMQTRSTRIQAQLRTKITL